MRIEEVTQIRYRVTHGDDVSWYDSKEEALLRGRRAVLERFFGKKIGDFRISAANLIEHWDEIKTIIEPEDPKSFSENRKIDV